MFWDLKNKNLELSKSYLFRNLNLKKMTQYDTKKQRLIDSKKEKRKKKGCTLSSMPSSILHRTKKLFNYYKAMHWKEKKNAVKKSIQGNNNKKKTQSSIVVSWVYFVVIARRYVLRWVGLGGRGGRSARRLRQLPRACTETVRQSRAETYRKQSLPVLISSLNRREILFFTSIAIPNKIGIFHLHLNIRFIFLCFSITRK